MYKLTTNELPSVFIHMFKRNRSIHCYPTRQSDAYHLPRTRTIFAKKTIIFTGPRYWNDLPLDITSSLSLFTFKRKLKQLLLSGYTLPSF